MPILHELIFDLSKVIDGAVNGDAKKILAYSERISERLEQSGEAELAKRLRGIVSSSSVARYGLAKASQLAAPSLPVDSESRLPLADEATFPPGSIELFLPPDAKSALATFLSFYREASRLYAKGVGITASMLLFGPPGCGKTQLAKYVAAETGLPLITARSDSLISSYLGSTAKNIRSLFSHASSRPCVLFLDEFDSIAKMRDDNQELGELKRVVISLLQNIDALGKDRILIAATNHEHLLDPAIWRRFACRIQLTLPNEESRAAMARSFMGEYGTEDSIQALLCASTDLSGSQIRQLADDSIRRAILSDRPHATANDVIAAVVGIHPLTMSKQNSPLADRLKAIRQINPKFFTQARLAEYAGISQPSVNKMLKGNSK
jgi:SpoVK/Ycf46/Vps4 family AAA+-type ATPase